MALYSAESNRGWVSFRDGDWEECELVNMDQQTLQMRMANGEQRSVNRSQCQFAYRNPSAVEAADDFLTLPNLDEPNILHSLRVRYWKGHVYSYTGPILIAVNPWRAVDIYNINMLEGFKQGKHKTPHIFGVATKAFKDLMANRKNQCILISGESGAGKTESTKYVLQVLTVAGDIRTGASASIEQQVMLTNPGEFRRAMPWKMSGEGYCPRNSVSEFTSLAPDPCRYGPASGACPFKMCNGADAAVGNSHATLARARAHTHTHAHEPTRSAGGIWQCQDAAERQLFTFRQVDQRSFRSQGHYCRYLENEDMP